MQVCEPEWIDRNLSLLAFNERVLAMSQVKSVPLLERLRYLTIVSSNLDEFFEVRASEALLDSNKSVANLRSSTIWQRCQQLVSTQYEIYTRELLPELSLAGVHVLSHHQRDEVQQAWVREYFEREVQPLLLPIVLDPSHPFPQVASKSLNFVVRLEGEDAFHRRNGIGIVRIPRSLPRVIEIPSKTEAQSFVLLSSVVRSHIGDLFPGREVSDFSQFRVTRHADLEVDEQDVKNLRMALREGLTNRNYGEAVRLEVSQSCSPFLSGVLQNQFGLSEASIFKVAGPVNLVRLSGLIDQVHKPEWLFTPFTPVYPPELAKQESLFARLEKGDVLIHQPFESFEVILNFLREAVADPSVVAIKQTLYRVGSDGRMIQLLTQAASAGKEVTVVLELKARFDEEANINWSEVLERVGVQVVYGVVGLKTHAKLLLITKRDSKSGVKRYAHLSTGNYNAKTARMYTDFSFFTADIRLTKDVDSLFQFLANQSRIPKLSKIVMAPFHLHRALQAQIDELTAACRDGQTCRIILKLNSLTDIPLMQKLLAAGQAGVRIDLIVRGVCMLRPGIADYSNNIRVVSVLGRFLEHTRIFYFSVNKQVRLFLSSADWMNRNMLRRIEVAWPIENKALQERVLREALLPYLTQTEHAWALKSSGEYSPLSADLGSRRKFKPSVQTELLLKTQQVRSNELRPQ